MVGLKSDLVDRCKIVFENCDEFESHETLCAVFVTQELSGFRNGLPQAKSKRNRINLTINYLRLQYLGNGKPVLPIFIERLCESRHENDALRLELAVLCFDFQKELYARPKIEIPFVVVAMTGDEVGELHDESFLNDREIAPIDRDRIAELKKAMITHGIENWRTNYQNSRDLWSPFIDSDATIARIIHDINDKINMKAQSANEWDMISCRSFSDNFFHKDYNERNQAQEHLRQFGGIFVVDSVSLFHPRLRNILIQSHLMSNDHIAIIALSPLNSTALKINLLIEDLIKAQAEPIFSRCGMRFDRFCEIGDGNLRTIQRWLFAKLPQKAESVKEKLASKNLNNIRETFPRQTGNLHHSMFR